MQSIAAIERNPKSGRTLKWNSFNTKSTHRAIGVLTNVEKKMSPSNYWTAFLRIIAHGSKHNSGFSLITIKEHKLQANQSDKKHTQRCSHWIGKEKRGEVSWTHHWTECRLFSRLVLIRSITHSRSSDASVTVTNHYDALTSPVPTLLLRL